MSTPLRTTENTDDPSLYIPKRAREGLTESGSSANHSNDGRSEQIQREQSLRRIEEQLGALKKALIIENFEVPASLVPPSLDPSPVPQPPVLRSRRRRALRMALTCVAASAAVGVTAFII